MQQIAHLKFVLIDDVFELKEKTGHQGDDGGIHEIGEQSNVQIRIGCRKSINHESKCLKSDDNGQVFMDQQLAVQRDFPWMEVTQIKPRVAVMNNTTVESMMLKGLFGSLHVGRIP